MQFFYIVQVYYLYFYDSFRLLVVWYKAIQNPIEIAYSPTKSSKKSTRCDHVSLVLHQFEKYIYTHINNNTIQFESLWKYASSSFILDSN